MTVPIFMPRLLLDYREPLPCSSKSLSVGAAELTLDLPLELGAQADQWVVEGKIYAGLGGSGTFDILPMMFGLLL